jgi:hypothetical protein
MGFFGNAFNTLRDIVSSGAGGDAGSIHDEIKQAEENPEQIAGLIGRLTNHPEIGEDVQSWLKNPEAQALLERFTN